MLFDTILNTLALFGDVLVFEGLWRISEHFGECQDAQELFGRSGCFLGAGRCSRHSGSVSGC